MKVFNAKGSPRRGMEGLSTSSIYDVEIFQSLFGAFVITPCNGYNRRPLKEYRQRYANLYELMNAWDLKEPEKYFTFNANNI